MDCSWRTVCSLKCLIHIKPLPRTYFGHRVTLVYVASYSTVKIRGRIGWDMLINKVLKLQLHKLCFYTYWSSSAISSLINSTMVSSRFWTLNFTGTCWYICRFWGVQPEYWNRNNHTLILHVWQTLLQYMYKHTHTHTHTNAFHSSNSTICAQWIQAKTNYKDKKYTTSKIMVL